MRKYITTGAAIVAALVMGCSTDSHRLDAYRDGAANIAPQITPMPTPAPTDTPSETPTSTPPPPADPWQAWGLTALALTFGGLGWIAWANARRANGGYTQ